MEPLAAKIRPTSLQGFVGQAHLVGPGRPLREAIERKRVLSFILWGPPGVGKTTLARIYAHSLEAQYHELSAVSAGKEDIRRVLEKKSFFTRPNVLFLDEIHRFNKAQQDFLLPYVESGELTLIGATTENPSFEIIPALLSRCQVFVLQELSEQDVRHIMDRSGMVIPEDAKDWLVRSSNGDARQLLTLLEHTEQLCGTVSVESLQKVFSRTYLRYDKHAEEHHNIISAFIKSMRASNPDAALYYLARMVEAGEDPKFIARRMVVFASEDVGLADPQALSLATAAFRAAETIGYPECSINLSHVACYLALAPKSRASYDAYKKATEEVRATGNLPVPMKIRNAPTKLMKHLGYGKDYEMYTGESLLPDAIKDSKYLSFEVNWDALLEQP